MSSAVMASTTPEASRLMLSELTSDRRRPVMTISWIGPSPAGAGPEASGPSAAKAAPEQHTATNAATGFNLGIFRSTGVFLQARARLDWLTGSPSDPSCRETRLLCDRFLKPVAGILCRRGIQNTR